MSLAAEDAALDRMRYGRELRSGGFECHLTLALQGLLILELAFCRVNSLEESFAPMPANKPDDQCADSEPDRERRRPDFEVNRVYGNGDHQGSRLTALRTICVSSSVSMAMMSAPHSRGSSSSVAFCAAAQLRHVEALRRLLINDGLFILICVTPETHPIGSGATSWKPGQSECLRASMPDWDWI